MKTNHRRKNPDPFKGIQESGFYKGKILKDTGGPNYSLMFYIRRRKVGADGMECDKGHRGHATDVREAKTFRQRTERRVANNAAKKAVDNE